MLVLLQATLRGAVLNTRQGYLHLVIISRTVEFFQDLSHRLPFGELGSKLCKLRMSVLKGLFDVLYASEGYLNLIIIGGAIEFLENRHDPCGAFRFGRFRDLREGVGVYPRFGVCQLLLSDVIEQVLQGNLRFLLDGVGYSHDGFAFAESLISKLFHEIQHRMGTLASSLRVLTHSCSTSNSCWFGCGLDRRVNVLV